jgi:hypothetical protein
LNNRDNTPVCAAESISYYGLDESSPHMKNLDTSLRLCGFAAIVATILISSSARSVAQANPSPAVSASPAVLPEAEGVYQLRYLSNLSVGDGFINMPNSNPVASPATSASPATTLTNVPIQGAQVNNPAPGITTTTTGKNITIQNSQAADNTIQGAQVNNPATATPGNTGNTGNAGDAGNAGNGGFNQHPGGKIKNKGEGQLGNAGTAGDDNGRKLHNAGQGGGWHKKQQQMQTQGQVSQGGGQGGDGQGHHHLRQVQSTQPQPQQQGGGGGGKGKAKPTPIPH